MPGRFPLTLLIALASFETFAADPATVSFEGKPGTTLEPRAGLAVRTAGENGLTRVAETPTPLLYDPAVKRTRPNTSALRFAKGDRLELAAPAGLRSFTLEMYVKPSGVPNRHLRIGVKSRNSKKGAEAAIGVRRLWNFRQSYWGGFADDGRGHREEWSTGHYVTISRLRGDALGWRHLALVYDDEKRTVSTWLDHWQVASRTFGEPLTWDDAPFLVGGDGSGKTDFEGLVDEVRLTSEALSPDRFLRAVTTPVENVDFSSPATLLPEDSGYVDLRSGFGAVGDGVHDDTAAFQKAFGELANKVPGAYYTLYVPPGNYVVSDLLRCSRFFVVQGAGRDRTTIRLRNDCPGFDDPERPRPVVRASSTNGPPGSNKGVNGSSIGIYFSDLTIDTGSGNPGAKGFEFHSNNHGLVENVLIRSGDGTGPVGLDLTHKTNGPALVKNVEIDGFDRGIAIAYAEYSMTLEHVVLRNQREVGVLNRSNILAVRGLRSENRVPAVRSLGGASMLTLLDSRLHGGDSDQTAMHVEGALYARNVDVEGYGKSLEKKVYVWHGWREKPAFEWADGPTLEGDLDEWWGDTTVAPFGGGERGSLKLPIEETPAIALGDVETDWINVRDFADRVEGRDWTAALQAAIDSGAKTVYLPQGGYEVHGTVHLRGAVERLRGMRASLHRPKDFDGEAPLLVYDHGDPDHVALLEHLEIRGRLHHSSPATLVMKHGSPVRYTTAPEVGRLFMENVQATGWEFDNPQQVWVRQWNPESHAAGPCIRSKGATIWALGFKTEYQSSKLWAEGGAKTEILGGFVYPVNKDIPKDRPVFKNVDSDMSLVYGMSVYVANHRLQVDDTQNGDRVEVLQESGRWARARFRMDLYTSRRPDEK